MAFFSEMPACRLHTYGSSAEEAACWEACLGDFRKIHEICLNMKKTFYKQEIYDILRWYEA